LQGIFAGSNISVLRIEGGWYAIMQLPRKKSDEEWAEQILLQKNIIVQPGHFYDFGLESCIIVSLLPISGILKDAFENICRFIQEN